MNLKKNIFGFLTLLIFIFSCGDLYNKQNEISSISAAADSIEGGSTVGLYCSATDQDGDKLSYYWEAASGELVTNGDSAYWTAPMDIGVYFITCTVSDEYGASSVESIGITVLKPNNSPYLNISSSEPEIKIGQSVNLEIDIKKRNNSRANHSATHLLHESLRRTLGKHVTQKGSLVSPERLRFDFSHNKPIEKEEIKNINKVVNEIVQGSTDVQTRIMTPKEAVSMGALALFGEKYGEEVRVVFMGKENNGFFSTELCGGTHVKNTKEVGKFKVISQSSIASGIRRVEALRNKQLQDYEKSLKQNKSLKEKTIKDQIEIIKKELSEYKITPDYKEDLELPVNLKNLSKQLEKVKIQNVIKDKNKNVIKDKKIHSFILRQQVLTDFPPKELRSVIDQGKKDIKQGIVVTISTFEGKVGVAVGVTEELTAKYSLYNDFDY